MPGAAAGKRQEAATALALLRRPVWVASALTLVIGSSLVAFLRFGWTPRWWYLVPLLAVLAVILVLDLGTKVIPDVIILPGIVYALIASAFLPDPSPVSAVLGMFVGGGAVLLLAVVSRGAVGGGDIKLVAMLGAALGWQGALTVLALSQVLAVVFALILLVTGRATMRQGLPVGAIISMLGMIMLIGEP